jgi:hypothetical protein
MFPIKQVHLSLQSISRALRPHSRKSPCEHRHRPARRCSPSSLEGPARVCLLDRFELDEESVKRIVRVGNVDKIVRDKNNRTTDEMKR